VHLLEPTPIRADEKQAIGRGTRFCGQKGLFFDPKAGWPLHVYRYESAIPRSAKLGAERFLDLQLQYSDIDVREVNFANDLEQASAQSAVDHELTKAIHEFSIKSGTSHAQEARRASSRLAAVASVVPPKIMKHAEIASFVNKYYKSFVYPPAKLENGCAQQGGASWSTLAHSHENVGSTPELSGSIAAPNYARAADVSSFIMPGSGRAYAADADTAGRSAPDLAITNTSPLLNQTYFSEGRQDTSVSGTDFYHTAEHAAHAYYQPSPLFQQDGGAGTTPISVNFTPSQEFVRHYFQPPSAYKGMLLYHGVGVGKTCSAIATASTSWEKAGYTILWVTRHTLKADISKNMYKWVCSVPMRERLAEGKKLGKAYLSKHWLLPISYKQFSNMLLKKNKIYAEMVRRNGEADPLRKTLVIIDEAHKLYAPDTPAPEKPNTDILEKMVQKSYKNSAANSVRLLLMTATPYTKSPVEMMRLLNLLRPASAALPTTFDDVMDRYLNSEGHFSTSGRRKFFDDVAGYISYLNRSADARNFAYPVIEDVVIEASNVRRVSEVQRENRYKLKIKELKAKHKLNKKEGKEKCKQDAVQKLEAALKAQEQALQDAQDVKTAQLEECSTLQKPKERTECRKAALESYKDAVAAQRNAVKEAKDTKKTDLEECKKLGTKATVDDAVAATEAEYNQLKADKKEITAKARALGEEYKQMRTAYKAEAAEKKKESAPLKTLKNVEERKRRRREITAKYAHLKALKRDVERSRLTRTKLKKQAEIVAEKIGSRVPADVSQERQLSKRCKIMSHNVIEADREAAEAKQVAAEAKAAKLAKAKADSKQNE